MRVDVSLLAIAATALAVMGAAPAISTSSIVEMTPEMETAIRQTYRKMPPKYVDQIIAYRKEHIRYAALFEKDPDRAFAELLPLADEMRRNGPPSHKPSFRGPREKFNVRMRWLDDNNVPIPLTISNPVAETLIETFREKSEFKDHLPYSFVIKFANSRAAKDYTIAALESDDNWIRERALFGINANKHFKGDPEIIAALKRLLERKVTKEAFVLSVLKGVSSDNKKK
jgi:hypothetical protein